MCGIEDKVPVFIDGVEFQVDKCLSILVDEMNKLGIKTIECCCGHGNQPPWIAIDAGKMAIDITWNWELKE